MRPMLMLSDARNYMQVAWWLPTFPGLALLVTLLGINNIVGAGFAILSALAPRHPRPHAPRRGLTLSAS
jgi:ABC-type dipeptide/oligopeptide/nickel transport system permease subunit